MIYALLAAFAACGQDTLPPLKAGMGSYQRKIHTSSPKAQAYFDQGLAMLYAFHKSTSHRSFLAATTLDPKCAMAWWGAAMALGPDINFGTVTEEATKNAQKELLKAADCAQDEWERDLITTTQFRFANADSKQRAKLDKDYSNSLAKLYKKYPNDPDVACLYAESLLILSPWNNWTTDGKPKPGTLEAKSALKKALKESPNHLMANHLWIHTLEASPSPQDAVPQADRLCKLAPGLGHLVHMPSHIYLRVGQWDKAVLQNDLAIKSDTRFFKGVTPDTAYQPYMAHNHMMLTYAACMNGNKAMATATMAAFRNMVPESVVKNLAPILDAGFWMPYEVEIRFGEWDKVLAEPEVPSYLPVTVAMRCAARAVAYAAKHQPTQAKIEYGKFCEHRKLIPDDTIVGLNSAKSIFGIADNLVQGEIEAQEKDYASAIKHLGEGIKIEDQLSYDEPPDWIQHVRHTLGAVLLQKGDPTASLLVYKEDLERHPHNVWSLMGCSQAYAALHQPAESLKWKKQFNDIWADKSAPVTSSCLCLPQGR